MFSRFKKEMKRYFAYLLYASKCELKSEVANSHLNWLWWILDPLCFMLVYMFIALVVFKKSEPYFPVYVFIGLTLWNFFSRTVSTSVVVIKRNKGILSKIYFPKYMMVIQTMMTQGFKMLISFALVAILMVIYQVPISYRVVYALPVVAVLILLTFGLCSILLHFGVFVDDLHNVVTVLLRLVMYLSGIFYSIKKLVPQPYNRLLLYGNPMAYFIDSLRECLLYCRTPKFIVLALWFVVGLLCSILGVRLIYRYENSYFKVI